MVRFYFGDPDDYDLIMRPRRRIGLPNYGIFVGFARRIHTICVEPGFTEADLVNRLVNYGIVDPILKEHVCVVSKYEDIEKDVSLEDLGIGPDSYVWVHVKSFPVAYFNRRMSAPGA